MTAILDAYGRPLPPTNRLSAEDADLVLGLRRKRFQSVIAAGLTPERLRGIFSDMERGRLDDFLTLAREVEKHDSHYRAVLGVRKLSALKRAPIVTPASDDSRDQFIAEELEQLVKSPEWLWMSLWLLDGIAKGFSVVEMIWDFSEGQAHPTFKQRDPRDFTLDRETLSRIVRKLPNSAQTEDLPYGKYIVHSPSIIHGSPMDGALAYTASILYLYSALVMHDMADFVERFGTPALLGEYLNEGQRQEILDGLASLARAGYGAMPQGVKVQKLDGGRLGGGEKLHEIVIRLLDEQKSKLVFGQTMTTDNGSSRSQSEVHDEVKDDVTDFDVWSLSATQEQQAAAVWVQLNYGDGIATPMLSRPGDDEDDVEQVSGVLFEMADRGAKISIRNLLQRLGVPDAAEDEPILEPKSTGNGDIPGSPTRIEDARISNGGGVDSNA